MTLRRLFFVLAPALLVAARKKGYDYRSPKTSDHSRTIDYLFAHIFPHLTPQSAPGLDVDGYFKPNQFASAPFPTKLQSMTRDAFRRKFNVIRCMFPDQPVGVSLHEQPPCPDLYAPVCADDGRTYLNDCDRRCANAQAIGRTINATTKPALGKQMFIFYWNAIEPGLYYAKNTPKGFPRTHIVKNVRMGPCILGY